MRSRRIRRENWVLPVLFFYAVSLMNSAGVLFLVCAVWILGRNLNRITVGVSEVLLLQFSALYFGFLVFHQGMSLRSTALFLFGPWAAFLMGKAYVESASQEDALLLFLTVLASGFFVHGIMNWFVYLHSDAYAAYAKQRISLDIWRGTRVSVTASGMFFTFAAGIAVGIVFSDSGRKQKWLALAVLAVCLGVTVFYANRTLLYLVALIVGWRAVLWFFSSRVSRRARRKALGLAALLIGLLAVLLLCNTGGFRDWCLSLKLVQRILRENHAGRFAAWSLFWKEGAFLRYPFGGKQITWGTPRSYLHNLWLDVYNVAGVFPFAALICVTVRQTSRLWVFGNVMKMRGKRRYAVILQCTMAAFFLNAMVEPVLEANPYFFLTALMFLGAMEGEIRKVEGSHNHV